MSTVAPIPLLARNLTVRLARLGWSQRDLCAIVDVHPAFLSRSISSGQMQDWLATRIACAMGCDVQDLVVDPPPPSLMESHPHRWDECLDPATGGLDLNAIRSRFAVLYSGAGGDKQWAAPVQERSPDDIEVGACIWDPQFGSEAHEVQEISASKGGILVKTSTGKKLEITGSVRCIAPLRSKAA